MKYILGLPFSETEILRRDLRRYLAKVPDPLRVLRELKKNANNKYLIKSVLDPVLKKYEGICQAVRFVLAEEFKKNPEQTMWTLRKSLSPGFKIGENVSFSQNGQSLKGKIIKIGSTGAHVQQTDWPRLLNFVKGSAIKKIVYT